MKTKLLQTLAISFILILVLSVIPGMAQEDGLISHWTFDIDGTNSVPGAGDLNVPETGVVYETIDGHKGISITRGAVIYLHNWGLNPGGSFTISMYMKNAQFEGYEILMAKGRKDESCHFEIYLESGYLCLYAPSIGDFKSGIYVNDNVMHHIAITYNGQSMKFFLDGQELKSIDQAGAIADGVGEAVMVGLLVEQGFPYGGFIDDVRLYNKPLSGNEIKTLAGVNEPETQPETDPNPETGVSLLPVILSSLTASGALTLIKRRKFEL